MRRVLYSRIVPETSGRPAAGRLVADQRGFTLLELAIVIFIMALMFTLAMPYMGGYRQAELKSQSRRLAGRASYLYDEAATHKLVLRLIFDIDHQRYAVARLDPYSANPKFVADHSTEGNMVIMPPSVQIRDVTVDGQGSFNKGVVACQFYPEGYVDATLIHLMDLSGNVMTLAINPLTGQVSIFAGDQNYAQMMQQ